MKNLGRAEGGPVFGTGFSSVDREQSQVLESRLHSHPVEPLWKRLARPSLDIPVPPLPPFCSEPAGGRCHLSSVSLCNGRRLV